MFYKEDVIGMDELPLQPIEDSEEKIKRIKIDNVFPPEHDLRYKREKRNREFSRKLKHDIEKNGLIIPPIVRPVSELKYEVVCGVSRVGAYADLGYKKIPVRVMELEDDEAEALALRENHMRKELSTYEEAHEIERLNNDYGWDLTKIEAETGLTKGQISKYLTAMSKATRDTMKEWKHNRISFSTVYDRVKDSRLDNPNPKTDFLTGEEVKDYKTIHVSENTKGILKELKDIVQKLAQSHTKDEFQHLLLEGDDDIEDRLELFDEHYGKQWATILYEMIAGIVDIWNRNNSY